MFVPTLLWIFGILHFIPVVAGLGVVKLSELSNTKFCKLLHPFMSFTVCKVTLFVQFSA